MRCPRPCPGSSRPAGSRGWPSGWVVPLCWRSAWHCCASWFPQDVWAPPSAGTPWRSRYRQRPVRRLARPFCPARVGPGCFAVNVPLGVLALLATRALPKVSGTARRLDLFSVALNAGAFGSVVIGAELLPARPALAAVMLATAAVVVVALIRREMPKEAPLIPFDLLRADPFRISVMASVCCFAGVAAGMVALPFYLRHGLGQDALMTGLYMTPWPLTAAVAAPLAGRLANRVSTVWLCAVGGVCLALGLLATALWPLHGHPPLVPLTMLCGLGFGLFQVPNNRSMFLAAPLERSGAAGGMQGTARLAGQTSGGMIMTLLFTLTSADAAPKIGLGIAALLTLLAGVVSTVRVRPRASNALGVFNPSHLAASAARNGC